MTDSVPPPSDATPAVTMTDWRVYKALEAVREARASRAEHWVNKFITDEQLDAIEAALRGFQ